MIELKNLAIHHGEFLLKDINLRIETGEYAVLMGVTGCGKTSLLEAICGLRTVDSGSVILDETDVTNHPAASREIGFVPQDTALFPTMRVEQQILFGLEIRKIERAKRIARLNELAARLDIQPLLKRYPNRLSGGEKQRVALARAIAFRPRLLCLDEPLSAVDTGTHQRLLDLLQDLHESESITTLHITHNPDEAKTLGTMQLRLEAGKIFSAEKS